MNRDMTMGRRLALGFGAVVALTIAVSLVAIFALNSVTTAKDRVISVNAANLERVTAIAVSAEQRVVAVRGFLLSGEEKFLKDFKQSTSEFERITTDLRSKGEVADERLAPVAKASRGHVAAVEKIVAFWRAESARNRVAERFNRESVPAYRATLQAQRRLAAQAMADSGLSTAAAAGVAELATLAERRVGAARALLLTLSKEDAQQLQRARRETERAVQALAATLGAGYKDALGAFTQASASQAKINTAIIALAHQEAKLNRVSAQFAAEVTPAFAVLRRALKRLADDERAMMRAGQAAATATAERAIWITVITTLLTLLLAIGIAVALTRSLSRQIGGAVTHMRSASTELQANANQLASASREQVSAVTEMTTTMKELLVSSRQISERAQGVSASARDGMEAARQGAVTVSSGQDAVEIVKRQVDMVVEQMLELGSKSMQIGNVLEIINELSDQTNILAVNASIEAAGAGEAGVRFGALADEIRKLADRVAGSTREIRTLVEEVRASVSSTIMATESGSKAADSATVQFRDVTAAFNKIDALIGGTATAARQIELSTQQQTSAAEQVSTAAVEVNQTVKENEAAARQTLEAASQLSTLSADLSRVISRSAA